MKLSKRLELLAHLVEKHKKGNILADIGTDHAYLPCYLIEKNIIDKAYACDVAKGPFAASLSTIKQYHFEENVEALLGDGLDPILDKEIDMVTIAGMGSFLIVEILEKNKDYLNKVKQFYLQPNANTDHLRKYLFNNHFKIIDEKMIKDGHHVYEMMVIENTNQDIQYSQEDIMFGPILRKNKDELFIRYWQKQYQTYLKIMKDLPSNHPRYLDLEKQNENIELKQKIITGKILHLDGDRRYSQKSYNYYKKLGLNAIVKNIPEYKQPKEVYRLLKIYNPDILIITGHDGIIKRGTNYNDIYNYRNSRHFINTVKEARRYDKETNRKTVIFAGACQSYFEAIISAGANFASSPSRILIDFIDPLIIAEKVATTEQYKYITIDDIEKELRDGKKGVGGIGANGKMIVM